MYLKVSFYDIEEDEAKIIKKAISKLEILPRKIHITEKQTILADSLDDHTSCWGSSGPDCIFGRLEAA